TGTAAPASNHNGVIAAAARIDQGASFNGSSSYLSSPGSAISTFTAQAWVRTTNVNNFKGIIENSDASKVRTGIDLDSTGVPLVVSGGASQISTSSRVDDGNWHLIVGTYDGVSRRIYVDGAAVGLS